MKQRDSREIQILIQSALEAAQLAYAPYSGYRVGAALLSADGTVYTGCNVECASFSLTNCAERTAVFHAVSRGQRAFSALAVAALPPEGAAPSYCVPCGACRQVLREFCPGEFPVICIKNKNEYKVYTLEELLPESFAADSFTEGPRP